MNTVDLVMNDLKFEKHLARLAEMKKMEQAHKTALASLSSKPAKEAH